MIDKIKETLDKYSVIYLANTASLNAEKTVDLRRAAFKAGIKMMVVKNTLLKKAMEQFYRQIGMPTSITELIGREVTEEEIAEMARKCCRRGTITIGAMEVLGEPDMVAIYRMAK